MEVQLNKLIGRGATADVYECGQGKVVKLFLEGTSIDSVRWEFHKAFCTFENKLPSPRVYEVIEYNNRYGIVMEHIPGDSLKNLIDQCVSRVVVENIPLSVFAEQILDYVRLTARHLYEIHSIKTDQIEAMDERMKRDVRWNSFLTEEEKNTVIRIIEGLPKGSSVCHGDPNPNNILINEEGLIFIDWVNSGYGNPMYDIAEYILLTMPSEASLPPDTHPKIIEFLEQYMDSIITAFLDEYRTLSGLDLSGYEAWFVPLLVSKLNSNRTLEEKYRILERIRKLIT